MDRFVLKSELLDILPSSVWDESHLEDAGNENWYLPIELTAEQAIYAMRVQYSTGKKITSFPYEENGKIFGFESPANGTQTIKIWITTASSSIVNPPEQHDEIPTIIGQPSTERKILAGRTLSEQVVATPVTGYEWYFNNVALPGNTRFLNIANFDATKAGSYKCRITNGNVHIDTNECIVTLDNGIIIRNKSNTKDDGTANGTGRNVSTLYDAGGFSLSVGSSAVLAYEDSETINFIQSGSNSLTLLSGVDSFIILGGSVNNVFNISDLGPVLEIFNNN